MERIIVVGAGGHGRVIADILTRSRDAGAPLIPLGFVDDTPGLAGSTVADLPVLGTLAMLAAIEHDVILIGIGENAIRRRLADRFVGAGERLGSAIHPGATISATTRIADGIVVCGGAVVQPGATLGRGVIINTRASVDHDSRIGDFAHVSPGATVGAQVEIGEEALIGLGASIIARRRIGARTTIGAGSVVVRDIPDDVVAFGNPARIRSSREREAISPRN